MDFGDLEGLIPLAGGIYFLLLIRGIIPQKDKAKFEGWKHRYGRFIYVAAPIAIVFGVLKLLGVV